MTLRDMVLEDIDQVMQVEQRVHRYPWTRRNFTDALASGYICKVLIEGEMMLGYVVMMAAVDEMELLNIGIAETHQRQGFGRMLLGESLQIAQRLNMRRLLLEVRPSNAAALGLYEDAGFSRIGLRNGYYQHAEGHEDAIVMERSL